MSILADRLIAIHTALDTAGFAHAFGGAIALAYCTQEPRGTRDVDVNVFVPSERSSQVLAVMPRGVNVTAADKKAARRDGQVRVMWDDTPVDLFFDTHAFHGEAAKEIRSVPFEGTTINVLGCETLIVFKAMFNRTKDWADIEAMLEAGADGRQALGRLKTLLAAADPAVARLTSLVN